MTPPEGRPPHPAAARQQVRSETPALQPALAAAVAAAAAEEHVEATLQRIVQAAADHVDARYGALGLLTPDGTGLHRFVVVGLSEAEVHRIGRLPVGAGILGLLVEQPVALRLEEIADHPASVGFPAGHPPMHSFLGVPVRVRDAVFGNLYLTEKRGGGSFTAADVETVQALAAVAGLAIENARLAERAERRRAWSEAGTQITTSLLAGADPDEVLRAVAVSVAQLTGADAVGVLVPAPGDDRTLTIAAAEGRGARHLEGVRIPLRRTHVGRALETGAITLIADVAADPGADGHADVGAEIASAFGAGLMMPLGGAPAHGVLVALRRRGREPFDPDLAEPARGFATQTAVVLALARAEAQERRLQVLADRHRIARDLHDHVVQSIFATALSLDRLARLLDDDRPAVAQRLRTSADELDDAMSEIRAAIFELNRADGPAPRPLSARLAQVVERGTEGHPPHTKLQTSGALDQLPDELAADLLAVVRELVSNVVRHAGATRVTVAVTVGPELEVAVTDDGRGLPAGARRSGLANLAERAERRGGGLRVVAAPEGTRLVWTVTLVGR